ncbi:hypothetical protein D3C71_1957100 [compost metagenome]
MKVQTMLSKLASAAWIWPSSRAIICTGMGLCAARVRARRCISAEGSTPTIALTFAAS